MRKTLKISALALALVMVLGIVAFAAPSVTGPAGDPVDENNVAIAYTAPADPIDVDKAAADPNQKETADKLAVVWQGNIPGAGDAGDMTNKPITWTVFVDGVYYFYHYEGGTWVLKGSQASSGKKVTYTFDSLSPVAVVQGSATTPQTGDNSNIALWGGLMVAAIAVAAGTVVYSRKRKNEA